MPKILQLGAGMIGKAIAYDALSDRDVELTVADVSSRALRDTEELVRRFRDKERLTLALLPRDQTTAPHSIIDRHDLVISALPGAIGDRNLKAVIEQGKNVVDISFSAEDPRRHDALAQQNGVTAIVDCGVAPGLSNLLVGYAHTQMQKTRSALIRVGGLPKNPVPPYNLRAVFAPASVIDEYLRPARMKRGGKLIEMPALTETELVTYPQVGTLEAFNTDGSRTLLSMDIDDLQEQTLRWPGHAALMAAMRDEGRFDPGHLPQTLAELTEAWELRDDEEEFTLMSVDVSGEDPAGPETHHYHLYDERDPRTRITSMARTTGFTATAAARAVYRGIFQTRGIIVPEQLGMHHDAARFVVGELNDRGVHLKESVTRP